MICGLNVGGNSGSDNGRGWVDPKTLKFEYVPIGEIREQKTPLTYRDIGITDVPYPHLPVHHDPEFDTFTYGDAWRGFGDRRLADMTKGDILFFYSTLDSLEERTHWGVYIIGLFVIDRVVDAQHMAPTGIERLEGFESNAHVRYKIPEAHLLIKGSSGWRLYQRAIPLSDPDNNRRVHPSLLGMLFTAGGKGIEGGPGWYRWTLCSGDKTFAAMLTEHS